MLTEGSFYPLGLWDRTQLTTNLAKETKRLELRTLRRFGHWLAVCLGAGCSPSLG